MKLTKVQADLSKTQIERRKMLIEFYTFQRGTSSLDLTSDDDISGKFSLAAEVLQDFLSEMVQENRLFRFSKEGKNHYCLAHWYQSIKFYFSSSL